MGARREGIGLARSSGRAVAAVGADVCEDAGSKMAPIARDARLRRATGTLAVTRCAAMRWPQMRPLASISKNARGVLTCVETQKL